MSRVEARHNAEFGILGAAFADVTWIGLVAIIVATLGIIIGNSAVYSYVYWHLLHLALAIPGFIIFFAERIFYPLYFSLVAPIVAIVDLVLLISVIVSIFADATLTQMLFVDVIYAAFSFVFFGIALVYFLASLRAYSSGNDFVVGTMATKFVDPRKFGYYPK